MAQYINFLNPSSKDMEDVHDNVPTCPGTCFFIDIVDSSMLKYNEGLSQWGKKINNTFNFISIINEFPDNIVKGIGDEIMIYISDDDLARKSSINNYFILLQEIYATIDNLKSFPMKGLFLPCKVSIHYCSDVYNITFLKDTNDYYGIDIDLTARLSSKARANTIVLSEVFYQKALNDFLNKYPNKDREVLDHVSEIIKTEFKGVPHLTDYRIIEV